VSNVEPKERSRVQVLQLSKNRIEGKINQDQSPFMTLWNGLDDSWKF